MTMPKYKLKILLDEREYATLIDVLYTARQQYSNSSQDYEKEHATRIFDLTRRIHEAVKGGDV